MAMKPAELRRQRAVIQAGLDRLLADNAGYTATELFEDKRHHGVPLYAKRAIERLRQRGIVVLRGKRYFLDVEDDTKNEDIGVRFELKEILGDQEQLDSLFLPDSVLTPKIDIEEEEEEEEEQEQLPFDKDDVRLPNVEDLERIDAANNNTTEPEVDPEPAGKGPEVVEYLIMLLEEVTEWTRNQKAPGAVPLTGDAASLVQAISKMDSDQEAVSKLMMRRLTALEAKVEKIASEQDAMAKLFMETASQVQEIHTFTKTILEMPTDFIAKINESHEVLMFISDRLLKAGRSTPPETRVNGVG